MSQTALLQPPDIVDILAGHLQCSRGTVYGLMQEALDNRDAKVRAESVEYFKQNQKERQAFFDSNNWNRKR
jgi:hypothetical protein